jgi:hypothetical protein
MSKSSLSAPHIRRANLALPVQYLEDADDVHVLSAPAAPGPRLKQLHLLVGEEVLLLLHLELNDRGLAAEGQDFADAGHGAAVAVWAAVAAEG